MDKKLKMLFVHKKSYKIGTHLAQESICQKSFTLFILLLIHQNL